MENKTYNDDVERVVNEPGRQKAIAQALENKKAKCQKKMLNNAIIFCAIALFFQVCGIFGLIVNWISLPVFAVSLILSAFNFGRWFENGKVYGWY